MRHSIRNFSPHSAVAATRFHTQGDITTPAQPGTVNIKLAS